MHPDADDLGSGQVLDGAMDYFACAAFANLGEIDNRNRGVFDTLAAVRLGNLGVAAPDTTTSSSRTSGRLPSGSVTIVGPRPVASEVPSMPPHRPAPTSVDRNRHGHRETAARGARAA